MTQKVLITGASGLIGQRLTSLLTQQGIICHHIGRQLPAKNALPGVKYFTWNINKGEMDENALQGVSAIIHLAGAGVADKRWTAARKKEIITSRVKSAEVLTSYLQKVQHSIKTFISASAVGYYGDCGDEMITESHKPGSDFLADVCKQWEQGTIKIGTSGIREVRCRIGIVLAPNGGALPQLIKTLPVGFAGYFSKTPLYYPWVHIDDVCGIMIHALQTKTVAGAYNTTAPKPLPIKKLMERIVKAKKSNAVLLPAPSLALKLALGEMSTMLLNSQNCSDEKIIKSGYQFKFGEIDKALKDVLK